MKQIKLIKIGSILTIILFMTITLIIGCTNSERNKTNPTAIEMMVDVFEGNHSLPTVKQKMDAVMKAYKIDVTERNYEKCGSALVSLRKSTGVTEMEIIDHMLDADTGKEGISFPDQAGISATLLQKK